MGSDTNILAEALATVAKALERFFGFVPTGELDEFESEADRAVHTYALLIAYDKAQGAPMSYTGLFEILAYAHSNLAWVVGEIAIRYGEEIAQRMRVTLLERGFDVQAWSLASDRMGLSAIPVIPAVSLAAA